MAVPKVDGQFITEAIKYIDENGVPWHNTSTKYELVWKNGNRSEERRVGKECRL